MTTIVTRTGKGSPLTWTEADNNFTNLNTDKVETVSPTTSGTLTHSGDVFLSGSGQRITGDFSNAILANRVIFQTSTVNGTTSIVVIPNGTATTSSVRAFNNQDPTNAAAIDLVVGSTSADFRSSVTGAGSYLPMTFYTGGSERMRIATDGSATFNGLTNFVSDINLSTGTDQYFYFDGALHISKNGTGERLQIDANGNVLVTNATGGLGYGTGAGGTVTQATSKSTAVTLNKPTGQIMMNNAALAAGATVTFLLNNTLIDESDVVIVSPVAGTLAAQGSCQVWATNGSNGAFISVRNNSVGTLSDALVLQFSVIKGVTA